MANRPMPLKGKLSALVIVLILAFSVMAPLVYPVNPHEINLDCLRQPPGIFTGHFFSAHPLGTDEEGRDILARLLEGAKISISVSFLAALFAMTVGVAVGLVAGYSGGKTDTALMALCDLILAFPSLLLAIGVSVVLPPGTLTVMLAMASVGWASFARLIRGHVLAIKGSQYVDAARAVGASGPRILWAHILPQCMPLAFTLMAVKLGGYIITEASLSFLGLGAQPPVATWGSMISQGMAYIYSAPWIAVLPGLAIAVAAFCFNMLGEALGDSRTATNSGAQAAPQSGSGKN
ncbi:MAG: ABC transporter permease [Nitrospiraceae bacterium]|nr:ABC transporter permease [Nitrospiraceae bacterium]